MAIAMRVHLFAGAWPSIPVNIIDIITIVAVVFISVLTDIEVIKSDSKDSGSYRGKVLACAAHQFTLALSALDHEDYAVYKSRKYYRITYTNHRRRVYDDVIEPFPQRAQKLFHAFRTYQF